MKKPRVSIRTDIQSATFFVLIGSFVPAKKI